jgi:hypothetical protein
MSLKFSAMKFFGLSIFIIGLGLLIMRPGFAQDSPGNGLRIDLLREEQTLTPGQNDSYVISVTNVSAGPTTVSVFVNDFTPDDETGQPTLIVNEDNDQSPYSIRNFVEVVDSFDLDVGESKDVVVNVTIPEEAIPGGYYGAIRFVAGSVPGEGGEGTAVTLSASVASLLLINVPGEVEEGLTLGYIKAVNNGKLVSFSETPPDQIAVHLENTGSTILKPFGEVVVKDWFGNEIYRYELNPIASNQLRSNILPKSTRTFKDNIENIGRFGRYTVEGYLTYGEGGGNTIIARTSFWVVPVKILLAIFAVIVAVVWFATRGIKMYNRKIVERAKKKSQ